MKPLLKCDCGATARDTSKERNRFRARHPRLCEERRKNRQWMKENAGHYRAVIADAPEPEQ